MVSVLVGGAVLHALPALGRRKRRVTGGALIHGRCIPERRQVHVDVTWLRNLVRTQHGLDELGALNIIADYEALLAAAREERDRAQRALDGYDEIAAAIDQGDITLPEAAAALVRHRDRGGA